jgi:hypothetical protein
MNASGVQQRSEGEKYAFHFPDNAIAHGNQK